MTANSSGTKTAEARYKPWGEDRYTSGTTLTTMKYTGQREESSFGLYYYGARWYDPYLNRWTQPDSILPVASQGVQAWDRFAYSNNNPVTYKDPSGHSVDGNGDPYQSAQQPERNPTSGNEPPYDPSKWGDMAQLTNNCYNYALNLLNGTFLQPGELSGAQVTAPVTAESVAQAATNDANATGATFVPATDTVACTGDAYRVALVIDPFAPTAENPNTVTYQGTTSMANDLGVFHLS